MFGSRSTAQIGFEPGHIESSAHSSIRTSVGGEPGMPPLPSVTVLDGGAPFSPPALMIAWFSTMPWASMSIVTWNLTDDDAPIAMLPPCTASAPTPRRTVTVLPANSPWSSAAASVFAPMFAPAVTASEPGTYVTPAGIASVSTTPIALSLPLLIAVSAYSSTSPAIATPPLTSVTVLVEVAKFGR